MWAEPGGSLHAIAPESVAGIKACIAVFTALFWLVPAVESARRLSTSAQDPDVRSNQLWGVFPLRQESVSVDLDRHLSSLRSPALIRLELHRAIAEFSNFGYTIRGTIVTHLQEIGASAKSSAGPIRIFREEAIIAIWDHVRSLLSDGASGGSNSQSSTGPILSAPWHVATHRRGRTHPAAIDFVARRPIGSFNKGRQSFARASMLSG
jgi:hypothetical protein